MPLYARALESRKPNRLFYDETALRVVDSLDYDFARHGHSSMNMWGCAARTVLFDQQASAHIQTYPDCCVINMACGLDDRFRRVDNGQIRWFNIDLPDVTQLWQELIRPHPRVTDLSCSVFDLDWMDQIPKQDHALVIAEGFLMYVTEEQVRVLFTALAEKFTHTTMLLELMSRWMVDHQKYHDTTKQAGVTFCWGVQETRDFEKPCPQYRLTGEWNFTDEMRQFAPVRMALLAPILREKNNRLGRFEQC